MEGTHRVDGTLMYSAIDSNIWMDFFLYQLQTCVVVLNIEMMMIYVRIHRLISSGLCETIKKQYCKFVVLLESCSPNKKKKKNRTVSFYKLCNLINCR